MVSKPRRGFVAWIVLAVSLGASFWAFREARQALQRAATQRLLSKADHVRDQIERRVKDYEHLLLGAKGLFAASKEVDRDEWRKYIESHELPVNYPGILALGYMRRIDHAEKADYVGAMQAELGPEFSIQPAGDRPEYFPVTFQVQSHGGSPGFMGYDPYSDSARRGSIEKAWESGRPILTPGLILRVDAGKPDSGALMGFVAYVPVFRNGVPIRSPGERRAALQGIISAGFRMRDMMVGLPIGMANDIAYRIEDGSGVDAGVLMFSSGPEAGDGEHDFYITLPIKLPGREWILRAGEGKGFLSAWEKAQPYGILFAGFFISALLTGLTWSLVNTRARADSLASAMTAELRARSEEFRELAERADGSTRAKSEFLANMSHELRTPLNSVIGFANILLKNKGGNLREQDLSYLTRIQENGRHLLALINSVLDLSKVEAGKMELEWGDVDLPALCRETVGQLEEQAREKGLELRLELEGECRPLRADAVKLKQVIINLIGNAIKFTGKGRVTLRLRTDGDRPVSLEVEDTGIGIPPERLEAIFEAFRQSDNSISRRFGGSGLGLTISRSLVRLMGFDLAVASVPGEGSTFSIRFGRPAEVPSGGLPAAVRSAAAPAPAPKVPVPAASTGRSGDPIPLPARPRRILVIDDEVDSRLLLRSYFEEFGCRVDEASGGGEGLRMARRFRPDLITVDLMMPVMEGRDVVREIKSDPALWNIPILIISIVAQEAQGDIPGVFCRLDKPVARDTLQAALDKALGGIISR